MPHPYGSFPARDIREETVGPPSATWAGVRSRKSRPGPERKGYATGAAPSFFARVMVMNVKPEQIQATAKLEGKAEVSVTVKVDGPGTVTGLSASSSGNVQANAGTRGRSMPQAAGNPGGY